MVVLLLTSGTTTSWPLHTVPLTGGFIGDDPDPDNDDDGSLSGIRCVPTWNCFLHGMIPQVLALLRLLLRLFLLLLLLLLRQFRIACLFKHFLQHKPYYYYYNCYRCYH